MTTTLQACANENDVLLFLERAGDHPRLPRVRDRLAQNRRQRQEVRAISAEPDGFSSDAPPTPGAPIHAQPSTQWPFQRFSWTDHGVHTGDKVSYHVVPLVRDSSGALTTWPIRPATGARDHAGSTCREPASSRSSTVASSSLSSCLATWPRNKLAPRQFKDGIGDSDGQAIRTFLSGDPRLAMIAELDAATKDDADVYAALIELADNELFDALYTLGPRAHVVLANGSITSGKGKTSARARQRDETPTPAQN
ncbi:MAG: hypothetical protein QOE41_2436 [Mycobacterium sp.]|jgi:hypothetical protein|nr:hypothetical protein [Mycobacterium sp.]